MQRSITRLVYVTAPLRRFGASTLGRLAVLAVGLAAMTAYTIPDLANTAAGWLSACLVVLPCVLCGRGFCPRQGRGSSRRRKGLPAIACGNRGPARHLSGTACACSGWTAGDELVVRVVMDPQARTKFARFCPTRTGVRVGGQAACQRAGVVPDHSLPRLGGHARDRARGTARRVRHAALGAVVGGGDADDDRLWGRSAAHPSGPHARLIRHDLRHRHVRVVDRYSGHRICRGKPPAQLHPDLGPGQQGAVLPVARSVGDCRDHAHVATARGAGANRGHPARQGRGLHVFHRRRRSPGRCQTRAGPSRLGIVLRRTCPARRFDPHGECFNDEGFDAADPRPCRFSHAHGASHRARARHRGRRAAAA